MFSFFKRDKKEEEPKKIVKDTKLLREIAISNMGIGSIYPEIRPISPRKVGEMLHNITISTPILSLSRGVCSRRLELRSKYGQQDDEIIKEIQGKFGRIENFQSYLKELSLTPYYGFTVFEKIYNEDFELKKLVKIPRSRVRYDWSTGLWYLIGNIEEQLTPDKFQISLWESSIEYPQGKSLFCYGLAQAYDDYNNLEAKVRGIQSKYGDIIPVFGFDEMETETEEGKKLLKGRAEAVKQMSGGNVMGVPLGGNFSLKESFFFISLSDLKIEMHKILLERLEKKIDKFIKGSVFSEGETGSYSRDSVQQIEKEKIEDDISLFITGELKDLLKYDGLIFGYSTEGLYWEAELDEGEEAKEEIEKKKAETIALKIETLNKTKELGYKISKEKTAEIIGVNAEDLEEIAESTSIGTEFSNSKKKIDFLRERAAASVKSLDKNINSLKGYFSKGIYKQALEQLKKMKTIEQLEKGFNLDLSYLEEKMTITALLGAMEEIENNIAEFSEPLDPFKMKYDEAITSILERQPILYNKLDTITEEVRARYTWVKKSTELETTKSLMNNLTKALEEGKTFKQWNNDSESILKNTGFGENGWYLNLVWRNNLHSAYNAGSYIQQEDNKENKPYGLYDAIEDGRESDICKTLNGKVYPLDHEFWDSFMPPNHHNCRSRRIAISKPDLREYELKSSKTITSDIEDLKKKMGDFLGNPASLQKTLKKGAITKSNAVLKAAEEVKKLQEFVPGKTIEEITKNMKSFTGMSNIDLDGISLEICQSIEEKYYKVFKKFPELKGQLNGFGKENMGSRTYAACYTMNGKVVINPQIYTSMKSLEKTYAKDVIMGYHPEGTTAGSIITHEIGHALDGFLTNNLMGITEETTRNMIKGRAYLTSSNLRKSVLKTLKLRIKDIETELSRYGKTNDREFFAEAFAEYIDSENPRSVAAEFGKQLEEIFKKKRGN